MTFTSQIIATNGQQIHVMTGGRESAPLMLLLHGFPEYWAGWAQVAETLSATHRIALPDQRGYNKSSIPPEQEAYDTKHLVADMKGLIDYLSPDRPVVLCGHDWGASVAYAMAMRHPDRISKLIIANGVHPICFQKSLFAAGPQTAASQYIHLLRKEGVEERLAENNFERLLGMLEKFSSAPWLDDESRAAYRAAWAPPGALTAMLNWYRQSPMEVPLPDAEPRDLPITDEMRQKYAIAMPHLLLWGMQDTALLPEARADLDQFCSDLTIAEHADASHWILHEQPAWVAEQIAAFLAE
ncbi:MAG: alpha/beta hydrolase [Rhizobiaceae bacterium]